MCGRRQLLTRARPEPVHSARIGGFVPSDRQAHAKHRVSRMRAEIEIAFVEVEKAAADCESGAGAKADRLGGEERSEDSGVVLAWNASAVIHHSHDDEIATPR